ncbi:MAG: Gfo/Idh/MocA family oxidoreductase [Anaerolineales bacterium]|nr:Gfo/Idh/MocA family oxidoreductase [Chloroflexota bacterium]MBL6983427.1 Gfo/Idh/MocA family oxidoreductase [Anaerolineales bacterium]
MNEVRWGLVSTANINKALIPAIRASRRGKLVAVASRSKANAEAYAQEWEIPQSFGSYQEMLDSGSVDAVYIGLPNHLHAEWSIKAMQAGVHVLCEKPFAPTLEEVDAMIAARDETGRVLAEAFMYRHHPQTKIAGEWAHSGKLGVITLVRGAFDFFLPKERRYPDSLDVRLVPEYGGGCLWDVGVYPLSFAQFIMGGPPDWVFGSQWTGKTGVDEIFTGQMGYSQKLDFSEKSSFSIAQISSSFKTPFHTFIEIIGTEGRLYLTKPFVGHHEGRTMTFCPKNGEPEEIPVPEKELYLGEVEDMHAAILDGEMNYLSLEETRNHVKTVLALYESAKKGEVISIR